MALYSLGQQAAAIPASGSAIWEVRSSATDKPRLLELALTSSFPTSADIFGFGRPAAIGITPTTPVTWLAENPNEPASSVQSALAWGTGPTVPANFFRRAREFGTTFWTLFFPQGIAIAVSSSLVVWVITLGTSAVVEMYGVEDE